MVVVVVVVVVVARMWLGCTREGYVDMSVVVGDEVGGQKDILLCGYQGVVARKSPAALCVRRNKKKSYKRLLLEISL